MSEALRTQITETPASPPGRQGRTVPHCPPASFGPFPLPRRITYDVYARSRYASDARRADYLHFVRWHVRTFKRYPKLQEVMNGMALTCRASAASLRDQCLLRGLVRKNEFGDLEVVRKARRC